jgi:hypothetical protein
MMASIFFTARLPASRSNGNVFVRMRISQRTILSSLSRTLTSPATTAGPTLYDASEHDEPKRLPRKQGLCQVANALIIGALSAF